MTAALASRVARLERARPVARPTDAKPLWTPLPGPQTRAYASEADITGYGGAAGGGKSMLEIGLAVTRHRKSIIFRREQDQVRDLWAKLAAVCGAHGRPNENLLVWRDLPGDRSVRLAGVKNERDWVKYQGHENDLYAFDELTEFSPQQFRTLIAWNRTPLAGQRCRVVVSFNPPTSTEGEWVIELFGPWLNADHPNPADPGELRWFAVVDGEDVEREDGTPFAWRGETITPLSRTFFPARLEDNPILEATGYRATLQNVPEPLRSQLLYGDFTVGLTDDEWQVIPTSWVRAAQDRWTPERPTDIIDGQRVLEPLAQIGVDIAQGGRGRTVLARRYGAWYGPLEVHEGTAVQDADANAQLVERALLENEAVALIDADGVGAATFFLTRARLGHRRVVGYRGSERTNQKDQSGRLTFVNVRAAAWWALREALDPSGEQRLALPPDRALRAELCAPRFELQASGLKLEAKADVVKRTGRSPDLADAVVMALWTGGSLLALFEEVHGRTRPITMAAGVSSSNGGGYASPRERLVALLGHEP